MKPHGITSGGVMGRISLADYETDITHSSKCSCRGDIIGITSECDGRYLLDSDYRGNSLEPAEFYRKTDFSHPDPAGDDNHFWTLLAHHQCNNHFVGRPPHRWLRGRGYLVGLIVQSITFLPAIHIIFPFKRKR